MSDDGQRSPKRLKLTTETTSANSSGKQSPPSPKAPANAKSSEKSHPYQLSKAGRKQKGRNGEPRQGKARAQPVFSQPSTISAGDRGIFVTSDKGREKKCLLELQDILQDLLGEEPGAEANGEELSEVHSGETSIEKDIESELAEMRGQTSIENDVENELAELRGRTGMGSKARTSSPRMALITLDIPCVSFVRFSADIKRDPVELVHKICADAASGKGGQRSRFIKRLTPISMLGKALSNGLETVCEKVLPECFAPSGPGDEQEVKYAIRPTIRNNDKMNRDLVIQTVAAYVNKIGEGKPKVDLKGYEKGILVEVYRGWVGICVVDNMPEGSKDLGNGKLGYEALRRYNLAEVYVDAQRRKDGS